MQAHLQRHWAPAFQGSIDGRPLDFQTHCRQWAALQVSVWYGGTRDEGCGTKLAGWGWQGMAPSTGRVQPACRPLALTAPRFLLPVPPLRTCRPRWSLCGWTFKR